MHRRGNSIDRTEWKAALIYLAEPLGEGRGTGEDCGLLHFVANTGGNKAGYTLDIPPTILTHTVKRTARVSLREKETEEGLAHEVADLVHCR